MDNKRRLFRLMEFYINDLKRNEINGFYGNNTKIKIHTISFSLSTKCVLIEAVVTLGDLINEEMMDPSLIDILIQDVSIYFFSGVNIKTYIRWDS